MHVPSTSGCSRLSSTQQPSAELLRENCGSEMQSSHHRQVGGDSSGAPVTMLCMMEGQGERLTQSHLHTEPSASV